MRNGHPLGRAGRSGCEDDPRVVSGQRRGGPPAARRAWPTKQSGLSDDSDDTGLTEYQFGAFVGIVGIDRHVCRAGGQRGQDRQIQRIAARRHPDPKSVATADAPRGQPFDAGLDIADHLAVGELHSAVVDRCRVGIARGGVLDDVDECPRVRGSRRQQILRRYLGDSHHTKILKPRRQQGQARRCSSRSASERRFAVWLIGEKTRWCSLPSCRQAAPRCCRNPRPS